MEALKWKLYSFFFIIISITQFFVLTFIAMIFYPGGTLINSNTIGYSFFSNFFSDLGRTKSLSGQSNLTSCIIYVITCCILSISMIPFSIAISYFFKGNSLAKKLGYSIMTFGALTGIFMTATILTPWDLFGTTHLTLGIIYTFFWILTILFIVISILVNESLFPKKYAFILIIYLIIAVINLLIVAILRYEPINEISLIIQATLQKLSVYSALICFLIIGYKAIELEKKINY
jgi:hypothetical protein